MKKIYATILFVFAFTSLSNAQTFDFTNSTENFTPTGAVSVVTNATTETCTITGSRTNFYLDQKTVANGGTSLNTANSNTLSITLKNNSGFTNFTFRTSTGTVIAGPITITNGDTGFKTYTISLTGLALWTGTLDGWRIFFGAGTTAAGDTIELDQIKFIAAPLGTNDFTKVENSIQLTPNPVTDMLNINTEDTIQKISVTDLLGRTVLTPSASKEINLSELTKGVYIISVATDKGVTNKKIIKN